LLLPRGLRGMNEWSINNFGAGQGLGQGNDMQTQEAASALTCQRGFLRKKVRAAKSPTSATPTAPKILRRRGHRARWRLRRAQGLTR
jgi:hypothetical protein